MSDERPSHKEHIVTVVWRCKVTTCVQCTRNRHERRRFAFVALLRRTVVSIKRFLSSLCPLTEHAKRRENRAHSMKTSIDESMIDAMGTNRITRISPVTDLRLVETGQVMSSDAGSLPARTLD